MKVISYSLFGYDKPRHKDCFDFNSYLRGLAINVKLARLLYPDWTIIVHTDGATEAACGRIFEGLGVKVSVQEAAPLTKAMLWRLLPIYNGATHVLCRDLDSPLTYREAQAVAHWLKHDGKAAHAITDSVSHNIPMLGGMIGFVSDWFKMLTDTNTFEQLFVGKTYNWSEKGTDQAFLNERIYPCFAKHGQDSIVQHYVKGMPQTFLSACYNAIPNISLQGVSDEVEGSNAICGHIGAAGWYETALFRFLRPYEPRFEDLTKIEKQYKEIFYWA